jgi:hypothetical protein
LYLISTALADGNLLLTIFLKSPNLQFTGISASLMSWSYISFNGCIGEEAGVSEVTPAREFGTLLLSE